MLKNKRGQGTLEYVILVTAVVVVIIYFLMSNREGSFQATMNGALNEGVGTMQTMAGKFSEVYSSTP